MRQFPYITVGKILKTLQEAGIPISRTTFYRLEREGMFASRKNIGKWRVYTPADAAIIVKMIKRNYGIDDDKE